MVSNTQTCPKDKSQKPQRNRRSPGLAWGTDPHTILYGPPPLERQVKVPFRFTSLDISMRAKSAESFRSTTFLQAILDRDKANSIEEYDGLKQKLRTMGDSGVGSPTNDFEHFPSLEDRARSSSKLHTRSGRKSPAHSASGSLIRASIIRAQSAKKAKKVRFYRNGDRFFKGMIFAVSPERFRTFESLLADLTSSPIGDKTVLPNGVRHIFSLDGTAKIGDIYELQDGEAYVCASTNIFREIDYPNTDNPVWNPNIRSTESPIPGRESATPKPGPKEQSFDDSNRDFIKPRLVTIIRNGTKPRKAIRILLNKKTAHSFEQVLYDITETIKLDSGPVKRVFTIDGRPVTTLQDFFGDETVFIAYGNERFCVDDFDVGNNEVRFVSAYKTVRQKERITLKSPRSPRKLPSLKPDPKQDQNKTGGFAGGKKNNKTNGEVRQVVRSPRAVQKNGSNKRRKSPAKAKMLLHGIKDPKTVEAIMEAPVELNSRYKIGQMIGEGNFATVRQCMDKTKRKQYALKIIDKLKCQGKEHMIESELGILRRIKHPNIVQLIEDYESDHGLYLVMELVKGGDLFDAIARCTKYTERDASGMLFNLSSALKYLHNVHVVHRDIKPENLMVCDHQDGSKSLKLGDFGLATECDGMLYTVCGTPTYVAPEIIAEEGYDEKVDVWSAGIITYILLCGFPPFISKTNDQDELFDKIMDGTFRFPSPYWDNISDSAKELIKGMLNKDADQRYSAAEVLEHPWVSILRFVESRKFNLGKGDKQIKKDKSNKTTAPKKNGLKSESQKISADLESSRVPQKLPF